MNNFGRLGQVKTWGLIITTSRFCNSGALTGPLTITTAITFRRSTICSLSPWASRPSTRWTHTNSLSQLCIPRRLLRLKMSSAEKFWINIIASFKILTNSDTRCEVNRRLCLICPTMRWIATTSFSLQDHPWSWWIPMIHRIGQLRIVCLKPKTSLFTREWDRATLASLRIQGAYHH